jgi:hypothetical protein
MAFLFVMEKKWIEAFPGMMGKKMDKMSGFLAENIITNLMISIMMP